MSKQPAFQLYAADFYMDTVGWECEEIGAYFRLLMAEWVNGPLPNDPSRLAKTCQMSAKKFGHNWKNVSTKFVRKGDGYLINERLEKTRAEQEKYIESQRDRANKRWSKNDAAAYATALPAHMPEACSSSSLKDNTTPLTPLHRGESCVPEFHSPEYQLLKNRAVEVLEYLNEKCDLHYQALPVNLRRIIERLFDGYGVDVLKQVIDAQRNNPDFKREWLAPKTLFEEEKFQTYLQRVGQSAADDGDIMEGVY